MEGPHQLLTAEQAQFGDLAGSAGRSFYGPSMSYSFLQKTGISVYLPYKLGISN